MLPLALTGFHDLGHGFDHVDGLGGGLGNGLAHHPDAPVHHYHPYREEEPAQQEGSVDEFLGE